MTVKRYQKANKTSIAKKSIPLDTPVIVVNNTVGRFFYEHERIEHVIDLQEATSHETLTLVDLKIMSQFSKNFLTGYKILIVDVLDNDFTLKDVYAYLDLMPQYDELMLMAKNEDGFDTGMYERYAVNSSVKQFTSTIMKMTKPAKERLAQALFHAYKSRVISNTQAGYDKVEFVANQIVKVNDDVIDILRNSQIPSVNIRELI